MTEGKPTTLLGNMPAGPFDHIQGEDLWDTQKRRAMAGDKEAARSILNLSIRLSSILEELFDDTAGNGRETLEKVVRSRMEFPIVHKKIDFSSDWKSKQMIETLPIGHRWGKFNTQQNHDAMNSELRLRWIPMFNEIRGQGPDGERALSEVKRSPQVQGLINDVCELEDLDESTAPKWANLIATWMSLTVTCFVEEWTWIVANSQALPPLNRRRKEKKRQIAEARDKIDAADEVDREKLEFRLSKLEHQLSKMVLTPEMVISGLTKTIPSRITKMV